MAFENEGLASALTEQFLSSDLGKSRQILWDEISSYHDPKQFEEKLKLLASLPFKDLL